MLNVGFSNSNLNMRQTGRQTFRQMRFECIIKKRRRRCCKCSTLATTHVLCKRNPLALPAAHHEKMIMMKRC